MAKPEQLQKGTLPRINRYFSEGFKRQKVEEIEKNLIRVSELSREYKVSSTAIYKWIYKYSYMRKKENLQIINNFV